MPTTGSRGLPSAGEAAALCCDAMASTVPGQEGSRVAAEPRSAWRHVGGVSTPRGWGTPERPGYGGVGEGYPNDCYDLGDWFDTPLGADLDREVILERDAERRGEKPPWSPERP